MIREFELRLGVPGSSSRLNIRGRRLRKQQRGNKAEKKQMEGRRLPLPQTRNPCPNIYNDFHFVVSTMEILDRSVSGRKIT